jgi:cobalt-precorrin 5A hydrolase
MRIYVLRVRRPWWTRHANGRAGPLPDNITLFDRLEDVVPVQFAAVLWVSGRAMPVDYAAKLAGKRVVYRPDGGA